MKPRPATRWGLRAPWYLVVGQRDRGVGGDSGFPCRSSGKVGIHSEFSAHVEVVAAASTGNETLHPWRVEGYKPLGPLGLRFASSRGSVVEFGERFESDTGYQARAPHPLGPLLPRRGEGEVLCLDFRENAPSFGLVLQGGSGLPGMAPHPLGPLLPRRGEGEVLCLDFRENAPSFGFVLGGGSGLPGMGPSSPRSPSPPEGRRGGLVP